VQKEFPEAEVFETISLDPFCAAQSKIDDTKQ